MLRQHQTLNGFISTNDMFHKIMTGITGGTHTIGNSLTSIYTIGHVTKSQEKMHNWAMIACDNRTNDLSFEYVKL